MATARTAAYLRRYQHWQSWAVLVAGVLSTVLPGALLMLGTGYTRRIETVVEQRTRDLEFANRRLQQEIEERRQAEAALRQAQRMEAIGQLTGGIARDFNNLLMVVLGNAAMLRDSAKDETSARRAGAILRAAERGERLTRQLLAFSRRQTLRPDAADLRQRAGDIAELLARSLRDDIEILVVDIPGDPWPVAVDQAEFELALLNIGVNARDAMPNGGRFRLAARNAGPQEAAGDGLSGDFVALTLSDTGAGMTKRFGHAPSNPTSQPRRSASDRGLGCCSLRLRQAERRRRGDRQHTRGGRHGHAVPAARRGRGDTLSRYRRRLPPRRRNCASCSLRMTPKSPTRRRNCSTPPGWRWCAPTAARRPWQ